MKNYIKIGNGLVREYKNDPSYLDARERITITFIAFIRLLLVSSYSLNLLSFYLQILHLIYYLLLQKMRVGMAFY
jgi:hypothetical protein